MLELSPKTSFEQNSEVELVVQTLSPLLLEDYNSSDFPTRELRGVYSEDENKYYFSYDLGSYLENDYYDNLIIRILGVNLYNGTSYTSKDIAMDFAFTPDQSILESPHIIEVNQTFSKEVYENIALTHDDDDYNNPYLYTGEINALTREKTIKITDLQVSNYKTIVSGYIMDDINSEDTSQGIMTDENNLPSPSSIRNQFVLAEFITYHYWNGLEDQVDHDLAIVDNTERIRLFVDGVELEFHEDTIKTYPLDHGDDGYYPLYIEFDGFSFENAQIIEIHFGEKIVQLN